MNTPITIIEYPVCVDYLYFYGQSKSTKEIRLAKPNIRKQLVCYIALRFKGLETIIQY